MKETSTPYSLSRAVSRENLPSPMKPKVLKTTRW